MPNQYTKKLIRIGKTGLGIIIPVSWIRYYNLEYGDSVKVVTNGTVEIRIIKEKNR